MGWSATRPERVGAVRLRRAPAAGSAAVIAGLWFAAAGCAEDRTFRCERSEQCRRGAETGTCESLGYCSFADDTCSTGNRFDTSAAERAGICTDEVCYGTTLVAACFPVRPSGDLALAGSLNTDTAPQCATLSVGAGIDACLVSAGAIAIDASLRATGARPLVLVAASSITVGAAGVIDVASRRMGGPGAGANPAACMPGTDALASGGTGGGGYGGSFGTIGGAGSAGDDGQAAGGVPAPAVSTLAFRGGCRGGQGAPTPGGIAGAGGGAVALIAGTVVIGGTINASGAGGGGGDGEGGGGGGAGGMIVLDARELTIAATANVLANGGGGGGGANSTSTAEPGQEATAPTIPAPGGPGDGGGNGGAGATGTAAAMAGGMAGGGGGGGGGGGAGVLVIAPPQSTGPNVSPPPR